MAKETTQQTRQQIIELKESGLSISQVAKRLGLSQSCVKKFLSRFRDLGQQGLERLSRRPKTESAHRTPVRARTAILETKRKHLGWAIHSRRIASSPIQ